MGCRSSKRYAYDVTIVCQGSTNSEEFRIVQEAVSEILQTGLRDILTNTLKIPRERQVLMTSQPDAEGKNRPFYASKATLNSGVTDAAKYGMGVTCRKGLKPDIPNQDSWLALQVLDEFAIYGVFDGHGLNGHDISDYVKEHLVKIVLKDQRFRTPKMKDCMKDAFVLMQSMVLTASQEQRLNAERSGTTATLVVHDLQQGLLFVAHVGDSGAVLARLERKGLGRDVCAQELTQDHKPEDRKEKARVEKAGGAVNFDGVSKYRVYIKGQRHPGLNMSRCLGDLVGHRQAGLTCVPDVSEHQVADDDLLLLLCSDGIWEFVSPAEAVSVFREALPAVQASYKGASRLQHWNRIAAPTPGSASENLAKLAQDRWIREVKTSVDDITVVSGIIQKVPKVDIVPNGTAEADSVQKTTSGLTEVKSQENARLGQVSL